MIREDHWLLEHAGDAVIVGVSITLRRDGHLGLPAVLVIALITGHLYGHALWRLGLIDRAPSLVRRWRRATDDQHLVAEAPTADWLTRDDSLVPQPCCSRR